MVDFTKHSEQWQQWMETNKQACAAIADINASAFAQTVEQINEFGRCAKNLNPQEAQEIFALQAEFVQEANRRAMDYSQKVLKILTQTAASHGEKFADHLATVCPCPMTEAGKKSKKSKN